MELYNNAMSRWTDGKSGERIVERLRGEEQRVSSSKMEAAFLESRSSLKYGVE